MPDACAGVTARGGAGRGCGCGGRVRDLCEDAADAPDVGGVGEAGDEERLRGAVLARADHEGRRLRGVDGGAEVDEADARRAALAPPRVEQDVFGLAVGVDYAFCVDVVDGLEELLGDVADIVD